MNNETYDVLRFVNQGDTCHIGSDCVTGSLLFHYLKYHPHIEKEVVLSWIKSLHEQLGMYHRGKEKAYYYINPLSVVVSQDDRVHLADLETKDNKSIRRKMERKNMKEMFYPVASADFEIKGDNYSLGRTILYITSCVSPSVSFSMKEKLYIKRLTGKLIGRQKENISVKRYMKHAVAAVLILAAAFILNSMLSDSTPNEQVSAKEDVKIEAKKNESETDTDVSFRFHTGMLYLSELGEYKKANEIFVSIFEEMEIAGHFADISSYLDGSYKADEEEILESIRFAIENYPEDEETDPRLIYIDTCLLIDTLASYELVLELADKEDEDTLLAYAIACEKTEKYEDAADAYEKLLDSEEEIDKEELYLRISDVYVEMEEKGKAVKILEEGAEELPDSNAVMTAHISTLCRDSAIENDYIKQTISKYREKNSRLTESEEFKKLMQLYKIKIEGEDIWVER